MITQNELKELLSYNPETGIFTRLSDRGGNKARSIAGTFNTCTGRLRIGVNSKNYESARLAWLYVYGRFPEGVIDHINHNPLDNRIENLRETTQFNNSKNCSLSKNNTSGFNGVWFDKSRNKWVAEIKINFKKKFIGRYTTKEEAIEARKLANIEYGFHENHGIQL